MVKHILSGNQGSLTMVKEALASYYCLWGCCSIKQKRKGRNAITAHRHQYHKLTS